MTPLVEVRDLHRVHGRGAGARAVLDGVSLSVEEREIVAILGPSGSGKSTLLNLLGGLDRPTSGEITIAGQPLSVLREPGLARFRRSTIGFVFQSFHLIPELSAWENVLLPDEARRRPCRRAAPRPRAGRAPWPRARHPAAADRPVGRRVAAGRDRAGPRDGSAAAPGRRADRQPRRRLGGGRDRPARRTP